jgi:hypothetical protein
MQDAKEPNLGAKMFGIPGDLEERFGTGAKEQAIDRTLVLQRQRGQLMRQCEDHMDVAAGQKIPATRVEPSITGVGLALRTVPVPTGVIGDGLIAATGTRIYMSAEHRCSTVQDGGQHFDVKPGQPLTSALEECCTRRADYVSHLHRWRLHLLGVGGLAALPEHRKRIQRTGGGVEMLL